MTTNYIERLGDAFMRPGRIDKKYELKECNLEQIIKMTRAFITKRLNVSEEIGKYPERHLEDKIKRFAQRLVDSKDNSNIKPCELQFYLLKYIDEIDQIFVNYSELVKS